MGGKGDIPTNYTFHIQPFQLAGGVDVDLALTGSQAQPLTVDLGLDDVNIHIDPLHIDPLQIDLGLDDINIDVGPLKADLGLDNVNVCLSLGITEFPRLQVHVPTRYDFGFCLFGMKVFNFTLAGETMLVTQDNPPRMLHKPVRPKGRGTVTRPGGSGAANTGDQVAVTVLGENESG